MFASSGLYSVYSYNSIGPVCDCLFEGQGRPSAKKCWTWVARTIVQRIALALLRLRRMMVRAFVMLRGRALPVTTSILRSRMLAQAANLHGNGGVPLQEQQPMNGIFGGHKNMKGGVAVLILVTAFVFLAGHDLVQGNGGGSNGMRFLKSVRIGCEYGVSVWCAKCVKRARSECEVVWRSVMSVKCVSDECESESVMLVWRSVMSVKIVRVEHVLVSCHPTSK